MHITIMGTVKEVLLDVECFAVCFRHALASEREENMGLLLGDVEERDDGSLVTKVTSISLIRRNERKRDRVEIAPEDLLKAARDAERITEETGITVRVVGWYHSHPHITCLPSHVDLRCQKDHQMLDKGFIGIICSVFNVNAAKQGRVQIFAFQSKVNENNNNNVKLDSQLPPVDFSSLVQSDVPITITRKNNGITSHTTGFSTLVELENLFFEEERNIYEKLCMDASPYERIFNAGVLLASSARVLDTSSSKLFHNLEMRLLQQKIEKNLLEREEQDLKKKLEEMEMEDFADFDTLKLSSNDEGDSRITEQVSTETEVISNGHEVEIDSDHQTVSQGEVSGGKEDVSEAQTERKSEELDVAGVEEVESRNGINESNEVETCNVGDEQKEEKIVGSVSDDVTELQNNENVGSVNDGEGSTAPLITPENEESIE